MRYNNLFCLIHFYKKKMIKQTTDILHISLPQTCSKNHDIISIEGMIATSDLRFCLLHFGMITYLNINRFFYLRMKSLEEKGHNLYLHTHVIQKSKPSARMLKKEVGLFLRSLPSPSTKPILVHQVFSL